MADSSPKIGKIFIGGLSYETTDEKLRSYFGAYGTVTDAVVMKDPISRRSRGFGFITYADPACVDRALAQPNHVLDSRRVEAKRAVPRAESSRETSNNTSRGAISAGSGMNSSSTVGATKKIFVGGLHYETKDADFRKYFQHYGKVVSAEVMFNRETNKSRGFGFVIFETEHSVELVLQDRSHVIDGKSVEVKRAVPRTDAPPGPPSASSVTRPLSTRGSFSDDPLSTPNRLLSPRSTPVSPLGGASNMSPSLPSSSIGGYAAAVRYGGRPLPSPAPTSDSNSLDGVEQLNIDDRNPQERPGPEHSRLFRPQGTNSTFSSQPYQNHNLGGGYNHDLSHNQWHSVPPHQLEHNPHHSSQWQQWSGNHPSSISIRQGLPNQTNRVFSGGMFDVPNGDVSGSGWDPNFQFGLGGFSSSGRNPRSSFDYTTNNTGNEDFNQQDEDQSIRFGCSSFMADIDQENHITTENSFPEHPHGASSHPLYRTSRNGENEKISYFRISTACAMFTSNKSIDSTTALICSMKSCKELKYCPVEHEKWCIQITKNPIGIVVCDPETRGSYMKKHTTYSVRQNNNNSVRRRFSDFEWLHATLAARYIGMLIPSLPEKNVYKTEAFIRSRMRGLTIFMNQVMKSPYLIQDAAVQGFLTVRDDAEWDQVKKNTTVMDNAGEGHMKWLQCLVHADVPEDPDRFLVGIKRDIDHVEKCCVEIGVCTKRIGEKCFGLSKDLSEMHLMFNHWKNIEFNSCDDKNSDLNTMLSTSTTLVSGWHDIHYHQPVVHDLMLHEGIKYIAMQVKDFKEILKQRDNAIQQFDKTARQTTSPLKTSSYFPRYNNEPTQADLEASAYRHEHVIQCINRALFFSEAKRLKHLKSDLLRDTLGPFACAEYQVAKRMGNLWSNFLHATDINQHDMMHVAKNILDSADAAVDNQTSD